MFTSCNEKTLTYLRCSAFQKKLKKDFDVKLATIRQFLSNELVERHVDSFSKITPSHDLTSGTKAIAPKPTPLDASQACDRQIYLIKRDVEDICDRFSSDDPNIVIADACACRTKIVDLFHEEISLSEYQTRLLDNLLDRLIITLMQAQDLVNVRALKMKASAITDTTNGGGILSNDHEYPDDEESVLYEKAFTENCDDLWQFEQLEDDDENMHCS